MKQICVGGVLPASAVSLGCMRINTLQEGEAVALLATAMEKGIDFFDHADIYGGGESERMFARAVKSAGIPRERMRIQSKCGIRPGCYDFSREHILSAVEGSLKRLETDYLDVLLLHRPDTLMEPGRGGGGIRPASTPPGKVRYFGVSNPESPADGAVGLLPSSEAARQPAPVRPAHTGMIDAGLHVNMTDAPAAVRDGGVLEYCRLKDITIQPWSPYQYGFFQGVFLGSEKYPELNRVLKELAAEKGVSESALVIAWILRHPAHMQPIVGTTKAARLADICRGAQVELTREEWYAVYLAAGNTLP